MHGISPRTFSLTPLQQKTSAEISREIPDFPSALSDLISEMAVPEFTSAMLPLELSEDYQVVQSPQNAHITACIEAALTAPSSECDPQIKASIFYNAKVSLGQNSVHPYLRRIICGLADRGLKINLDDVVLTDLDLSSDGERLNFIGMPPSFDRGRLNLFGLSAKRSTFSNVKLSYNNLDSANFTGTNFDRVCLSGATMNKANVTDAVFSNLTFMGTEVNQLIGNQSTIFDYLQDSAEMAMEYNLHPSRFDIAYLSAMHFDAEPNRASFTLPGKKLISPWTHW